MMRKRMLHHLHEYTAPDNGFSIHINPAQRCKGRTPRGGILHSEDSRVEIPTPATLQKQERLQLAEARFRDKY